jgi:hypothetical protein
LSSVGLRTTVAWMLHGHANTTRTLEAISNDLRDLQLRVDELTRAVEVDTTNLRDQQIAEFAVMRDVVVNVTDDLAARVAVLRREIGAS